MPEEAIDWYGWEGGMGNWRGIEAMGKDCDWLRTGLWTRCHGDIGHRTKYLFYFIILCTN